ncbi:MAG: CapA family protein [Clostridia bacterium]|nr:CapA family protein [Clostridia bacterium]
MRKIMAFFLASVLFLDMVSVGVILYSRAKELSRQGEDDVYARATVAAMGNNLISDEMNRQAFERSSGEGYDYKFFYEGISDEIADKDIALLTLESVMSSDHEVTGGSLLNAPDELADTLTMLGVNVVNLASPHVLDYGEKGLENTLACWAKKNVSAIGAYKKSKDGLKPVIRNVNGIKIGFVGYTEKAEGLSGSSKFGIMNSQAETAVRDLITETKAKSDVVIVYANWGEEFSAEITEKQRESAQKLSDWGADVVIGTFPRVIQPIEYIVREDGTKTLVAYSLGNLISTGGSPESLLGGILEFDIVRKTSKSQAEIKNIRIKGVITHYGENMTKIRSYMLSDYSETLASGHALYGETEWNDQWLNATFEKTFTGEFRG